MRLEYELLDSPAWLSLSKSGMLTYIYLRRQVYKRLSGGRVVNRSRSEVRMGPKDLCGILSGHSFQKGIFELADRGFIVILKQGGWPNRKGIYEFTNDWIWWHDPGGEKAAREFAEMMMKKFEQEEREVMEAEEIYD